MNNMLKVVFISDTICDYLTCRKGQVGYVVSFVFNPNMGKTVAVVLLTDGTLVETELSNIKVI
jgi:hypothetical protein